MTDGKKLRSIVEHNKRKIVTFGDPIIADGKCTIEMIGHSFIISYNEYIDTVSINNELISFCFDNNIDYQNLLKLEKDEYQKIYNTITSKFVYFEDDIHSRRVLWTDDCCMSMIQLLVRNNTINCFLILRSSDVVGKQFSDLNLVHLIIRAAQDKLNIKNVCLRVTAHSMHFYR